MRTVELGRTGMQISRVGLGAWAIGGSGWWDAWGEQDDEASIATIRRAVELGINWVDTAPIYGLGHSEEVVGRALEGLPERPLCSRRRRCSTEATAASSTTSSATRS